MMRIFKFLMILELSTACKDSENHYLWEMLSQSADLASISTSLFEKKFSTTNSMFSALRDIFDFIFKRSVAAVLH